MNRQTFMALWGHFREANGIGLRLVDALPADQLDSTPIPTMRTPKELVVHLYGQLVKNVGEGLASGVVHEFDEKTAVASIKTKDDLMRFCRDAWKSADKAASQVTDASLAAMVKTPWGSDMPGVAAWGVLNDEFYHHRGQLYCYVRALGREVPAMWDFEHSGPEFKAHMTANA